MNVYIIGTHGCGKTTTIRELIKRRADTVMFSAVGDDHGNPIVEDVGLRQAFRLGKYFSDAAHLRALERSSVLKPITLVDRSPIDWLAYTNTFQKQGKIAWSDYCDLEHLFYEMAQALDEFIPRNIIYFNPPFEWTVERIKQRWNEEKQKWNEGDFEYLRILKTQYDELVQLHAERNRGFTHKSLVVSATNVEERVQQISYFLDTLKGP